MRRYPSPQLAPSSAGTASERPRTTAAHPHHDARRLASHIRARGAFDGAGKIVELPPQRGDPENMDRDDQVFRQGILHLLSFVQEF